MELVSFRDSSAENRSLGRSNLGLDSRGIDAFLLREDGERFEELAVSDSPRGLVLHFREDEVHVGGSQSAVEELGVLGKLR